MEPILSNFEVEKLSKKLFILEDEGDIADLVAINLKKAGFKTKEFYKADSFFVKYLNQEKTRPYYS